MIPRLEERYNEEQEDREEEGMGLMQGIDGMDVPGTSLSKIAGVIEQNDLARLRRMIFRATKGKSFLFT